MREPTPRPFGPTRPPAQNPPLVRESVLDRLLGPDTGGVQALRKGIHRDLVDLLNTEQRVAGWPASLAELDTSILNFGILCFATTNLATEQHRAAAAQAIGDTVRAFEPRLGNLAVTSLSNPSEADRTLAIRIEAEIMVEPSPTPIVLDTLVDPVSNAISVVGPNGE